jgi:uncharacterized protein YdhG (YjbR/CyaY superfamily)
MNDSDTKKTTRPGSIDNYLATLPEDKGAVLEKLRRIIRIAVPDATEVISYRMPAYKYHGKLLVGFAAFKDHCSFFVMSPNVMRAHAVELKSYDITKGGGGIRFPVNKPLPAVLVKKLVKARIAENEKNATKKKVDRK